MMLSDPASALASMGPFLSMVADQEHAMAHASVGGGAGGGAGGGGAAGLCLDPMTLALCYAMSAHASVMLGQGEDAFQFMRAA
jgi:hypothetical protein